MAQCYEAQNVMAIFIIKKSGHRRQQANKQQRITESQSLISL